MYRVHGVRRAEGAVKRVLHHEPHVLARQAGQVTVRVAAGGIRQHAGHSGEVDALVQLRLSAKATQQVHVEGGRLLRHPVALGSGSLKHRHQPLAVARRFLKLGRAGGSLWLEAWERQGEGVACMGQLWDNYGTTMGQPMGQPMGQLMFLYVSRDSAIHLAKIKIYRSFSFSYCFWYKARIITKKDISFSCERWK